ncbi:DMT family transporter [Algirhabdus cladophorae]|uniref:DMT family transporter n=1 Tax=Algirhabdus cladophorae TaxID=3377108 RepID=UPI003B845BFD
MINSLTLGLIAALCWGFHDICVRYVSQKTPLMAMLLTVLLVGLAFHLGLMTATGGFETIALIPALYAGIAGLFFLLASLGLYYAFERGPVRLVSPIIGAYPVLSIAWATIQGTPITALQILAVLAIIAGVGMVAALADQSNEDTPPKGLTILYSFIAAVGFAGTFAFGQHAAELSAEMPATLVTRILAPTLLVVFMLVKGHTFWTGRKALPVLILMGIADGIALLCVVSASGYANPEYAAVTSSIFGLITIVLAWAILREAMTRAQWLGCAVAFAGIGYLAL